MRDPQDVDVLSEAGPSPARSALRWSLPTALAVIIVDQLTKAWALDTLAPGPCSVPDACIDLVAGVRFNLVFNTGAAFTRGSGYGPLIGVLAFVMTGVLIYLSTKRQDRFGIVLFGALAGGAVGNLLDRIFRADDGPLSGAVIDFIDVGWWPVFNVADMAIVTGVVAIIAHAFLVGEPDAPDAAGDPDGGDGHDVDVESTPEPEAADQPSADVDADGDGTAEAEPSAKPGDDADAGDSAELGAEPRFEPTVEHRDDAGSAVGSEVVPGPSNDRPE